MDELPPLPEASQTPLLDLLRAVPADARQVYEHGPTHSQNIPFGRLAAEAVAEIERLRAYAAAAVAKERELCAKVCESYGRNVTTVTCAAAIRSAARSLGTVQPPAPPASGLAP